MWDVTSERKVERRHKEYNPAIKKYFKSLNYEWLEQYFQIKKTDEKMLSDPRREIVNKGGAVFFLLTSCNK